MPRASSNGGAPSATGLRRARAEVALWLVAAAVVGPADGGHVVGEVELAGPEGAAADPPHIDAPGRLDALGERVAGEVRPRGARPGQERVEHVALLAGEAGLLGVLDGMAVAGEHVEAGVEGAVGVTAD